MDVRALYGGFLDVRELRTLLDSVQTAAAAKRQEAHAGPFKAAVSEVEGLSPGRP